MVIMSGSAELGLWIVGDGISQNVRSITCIGIPPRRLCVCLQPVSPARRLLPSWKAPWHALELSASCQSQIACATPKPQPARIAVHDVPPPS